MRLVTWDIYKLSSKTTEGTLSLIWGSWHAKRQMCSMFSLPLTWHLMGSEDRFYTINRDYTTHTRKWTCLLYVYLYVFIFVLQNQGISLFYWFDSLRNKAKLSCICFVRWNLIRNSLHQDIMSLCFIYNCATFLTYCNNSLHTAFFFLFFLGGAQKYNYPRK